MPILSNKKQRKNYRLIGASLPVRVHQYLTLYSLSKGCSKSIILKTIIDAWMVDRDTEPQLIKNIASKINEQWKVIKASKSKMTFQEFHDEMKQELVDKGLSEKHISTIMFEIDE